MLNSRGERTDPCLRPRVRSKDGVSFPLIMTVAEAPSSIAVNKLISFEGTPCIRNISHKVSLCTLS